MSLEFRKLGRTFAAEAAAPDLRTLTDESILREIAEGLDEHAVLVFRDQLLTDAEQTSFTERLGRVFPGASAANGKSSGERAKQLSTTERQIIVGLIKVSNLDDKNEIVDRGDMRRVAKLGNRIWHTDGSSVEPSSRYTLLSGRIIPPVKADTEFADTRAAYDALDAETKKKIADLHIFHSLVYSRGLLGFTFPQEEQEKLKGAVYPVARTIASSGRKSLYLGAHAAHVVEWPVAEGRLLIQDLTEHATQDRFVYRHDWRPNDLVIWDNRATLHRARPFDDTKYQRDMRRTMTLDLEAA
jgi:alpha-ketoglutarate-dependent 2,4-dichlorophenoxyacetate dioxygenase